MDTANTTYTFGMATGEIILLLSLAFFMGMLLCWLLRQMGLCCQPRKKPLPTYIPPETTRQVTPDVYVPKVQPKTLDVEIPAAKLDVDVPDIAPYKQRPIIDMPDMEWEQPEVKLPDAELDIPKTTLPEAELYMPEVELPEAELHMPATKLDLLTSIDPHKPIIDMPDMKLDTDLEMQTMHIEQQDIDPLLVAIDPHKPIIDPPDMDLEADVEIPALHLEPLDIEPLDIEPLDIDPLLLAIDPHKPIIDPPDMDLETDVETSGIQLEPLDIEPLRNIEPLDTDPLLAAIDPHKPIIDPPDMPEASTDNGTTGSIFNDWLHKAKDSVEHLTEKATPAASEWLHKAKDSMEHLTEKATPTASEWLHKAKDSVEHLTEKASPTSNEWLNKAKEFGSGLTSKGNSLGSETLVKSSSTLAALAASAKELTEKLASNLSIKHDDLQKLVGIGPTFASVLHRAGIHTYQQLADTSPQKLQALLIVEDEQFSQHDTSSWPTQAALAAQGEWEKLQAYQDSL